MVKQPVSKGGTSRIRFIMLEAEIPEGDLSQITAAIQNALKPGSTIVQQRIISQPAGSTSTLDLGGQDTVGDLDPGADDIEAQGDEKPPRTAREPRPRKPSSPKVLELDLSTNVSLESYAGQYQPKSEADRNLVVLAWLKEHRGEEAATVNHIYTCYRALKWPSNIEDFSWPLRSLKKEQLVKSPGRGQYVINHLGLARVEKMGSGN